jgi:hypothetical protein
VGVIPQRCWKKQEALAALHSADVTLTWLWSKPVVETTRGHWKFGEELSALGAPPHLDVNLNQLLTKKKAEGRRQEAGGKKKKDLLSWVKSPRKKGKV